MTLLLEKAFIHATTYKTKKGKTVQRKAYTDKRIAKQVVAKDRINIPSIQNKSPKQVSEELHSQRDELKDKLDEVRQHKTDLIEAKEKGQTHTDKGVNVDHSHHIHKHEKNLHEKLETANHKLMLHENRYELQKEKGEELKKKRVAVRKEAQKKTEVEKKQTRSQSMIGNKNAQKFGSHEEYSDWLRGQSEHVKETHKLDRIDGELTATWLPEKAEPEKREEKKVVVKKKEKPSDAGPVSTDGRDPLKMTKEEFVNSDKFKSGTIKITGMLEAVYNSAKKQYRFTYNGISVPSDSYDPKGFDTKKLHAMSPGEFHDFLSGMDKKEQPVKAQSKTIDGRLYILDQGAWVTSTPDGYMTQQGILKKDWEKAEFKAADGKKENVENAIKAGEALSSFLAGKKGSIMEGFKKEVDSSVAKFKEQTPEEPAKKGKVLPFKAKEKSLSELFKDYYSASPSEKPAIGKLAQAKFKEENPDSSMQDYLKAAKDAKPSEDEKLKTEAEEKKNRSEAMMGNKNAEKPGGPVEEPKKQRVSKEVVAKKREPKPVEEIKPREPKEVVVSKEKIVDFGEKIGGARKDMWKEKYLEGKDIADLNDRELTKHVTKDKIWPKPNYEDIIKSGMNPNVVFLIKKIRDSIPAKMNLSSRQEPQIKEYAKKYVELIEKSRDFLSKAESLEDLKGAFDHIFGDEHEKGVGWKVGREPSKASFYTRKFANGIRISNWDLVKAKQAVEKGWGLSEPWMRKTEIKETGTGYRAFFDGKTDVNHPDFKTEQEAEDWVKLRYEALKDQDIRHGTVSKMNKETGEYDKVEGWFATKGSFIRTDTMKSKWEVEKTLIDRYKANPDAGKKKKGKKQKFVRPQLAHVQRDGTDHRAGKDINTGDFHKTFGFKGGEFGNWNSQSDRQQSMNHAHDALMDLSTILGIDAEEISLDNDLSIAFGARGKGLSGASAHYEPDRKVINLTKMNGAGSLAHEWSHAFDDFLKNVSGDQTLKSRMATDGLYSNKDDGISDDVEDAFKNIVTSMNKKDMSLEDYKAVTSKSLESNTIKLKGVLDKIRDDLTRGGRDYKGKKLPVAATDELKEFDEKIVPSIMKGAQEGDKSVQDGKKKYSIINENLHNLTNVFYKKIIGRNANYHKDNLKYYHSNLGRARRQIARGNDVKLPKIDSEYKRGARKMGLFFGKGTYWTNPQEMFARAFESYINDKLKDKDQRSDYLVHSTSNEGYKMFADPDTGESPAPYPEGEERARINKAFDNFFEKYKSGGKVFPRLLKKSFADLFLQRKSKSVIVKKK